MQRLVHSSEAIYFLIFAVCISIQFKGELLILGRGSLSIFHYSGSCRVERPHC